MSPHRRLWFTVLVCFLATFTLASVLHHSNGPCLDGETRTGNEETDPNLRVQNEASESGFPQLLRATSPDILHRLLHAYFPSRYRHGVYPSDHDALLAVHRDNAPLATSLARLAKRQDGGTNSTKASVPNSSSNTPSTPNSTPTPKPPAPGTDTSSENPPKPDDSGNNSANSNPPSNNEPDPTPDPTPTNEPDTPGTSPKGEQTDEPPAEPSDEPSTSSDPPSDPPAPSPPTESSQSSPDSDSSSNSPSSPSTSESSQTSQTSPDEDSSDDTETTPPPSPASSLSPLTPIDTPDTPKKTTPPKSTRTPSKSASLITKTSTDAEGHIIKVTSTSYYDVYPTDETEPTDSASLQNAGSRMSSELLLSALLGMAVAGFLVI